MDILIFKPIGWVLEIVCAVIGWGLTAIVVIAALPVIYFAVLFVIGIVKEYCLSKPDTPRRSTPTRESSSTTKDLIFWLSVFAVPWSLWHFWKHKMHQYGPGSVNFEQAFCQNRALLSEWVSEMLSKMSSTTVLVIVLVALIIFLKCISSTPEAQLRNRQCEIDEAERKDRRDLKKWQKQNPGRLKSMPPQGGKQRVESELEAFWEEYFG